MVRIRKAHVARKARINMNRAKRRRPYADLYEKKEANQHEKAEKGKKPEE